MTFLVRVLVALAAIAFLISNGPQSYRTAKAWIESAISEQQKSQDVTSGQRAKELVAKGQREQLVSFREELEKITADATHQYYALGVGQVTLRAPEDIPDVREMTVTGSTNTEQLLNGLPSIATEVDCDRYPITGSFNNILLFDKKQDAFTVVFDKRVSIRSFQTTCRAARPVLLVWAAEEDTDHDGSIGASDDETLYLFALDDKTMHRIALEHMQIVDVWSVPDAGFVLAQCRVDRNQDGKFGAYDEEPTTIMRIDLKTFAATPFVPGEIVTKLQHLLEGREVEAPKGQ